MKSRDVLKASTYLSLGTVLEKVFNFLSVPILVKTLSTHDYGALQTAISLVGIISIVYLNGLNSSLFQFYSSWQESWDKKIYEKLVYYLVLAVSLAVLVVLLLASSFLPLSKWLGVDFSLFALVLMSAIASLFVNFKSAVWIVDGQSRKLVIVNFAKSLIIIGSLFFLIKVWPSVYLKPALEVLVGLGFSAWIIWEYFKLPAIQSVSRPDLIAIVKKSFTYGWSVQFSQVAYWVFTSADKVIMASILGGASVARYSVLLVAMTPVFVVANLNATVSVQYNKMIAEGVTLEKINSGLAKFIYLIGGGCLFYKTVLFFFSPLIVKLISTHEYAGIGPLMHFCAESIFLYASYLILSRYLHAKLMLKQIVSINIGAVLVSLSVNFLLVNKFGIMGALFAQIVSYLTLAVMSFGYHLAGNGFTNGRGLYRALGLMVFLFVVFDAAVLYAG